MMKKAVSLILAAVLLLCAAVPVTACASGPNIKLSDLDPQLRLAGFAFRTLLPSFNKPLFKFGDAVMRAVVPGIWLGSKTEIRQEYVTREDGTQLRLVICTSKSGVNPNATGLLWLHGGGYALGLPEQTFGFMDNLIADGNSVAVLPDYISASKEPYPAQLNDCYLALKWMVENAETLGINKNQIFVGGESAGGGLTAALCLYARDKKEVNIAFQMPLYPMIDDRETESSKNNDAPVWNSKSNKAAWEMYLGDLTEIPAYAAPARASDYSNLPPACTFVGTVEPFYDETVAFVKNLRSAGVSVTFKEYEGCFHAFDMLVPSADVSKDAKAFLKSAYDYAQENYFAEN